MGIIVLWRKEIGDEAKKQLWLAGPMVCVSLFQYSLQMISLMFVGHLDELLLASAALATSFVSVTGFNVLMGMSSVLDTFCGQSYGAQEYGMVGIHRERAILLGMKGAAIAICISNWFNTIVLALYINSSSSCKSTWTGFSRKSLHNIPQFLKLAFPSTAMVCLETWMFEMMVLLSGALPNPKLQTSVLSICLTTSGIFWMIPFGISAAGSTRISNELGAGRPKAAYLAVKVSLFIAFIMAIIEFVLLMLVRNIWGRAFTEIHEVVTYVASMTPILAASAFLDSIQTAFQGIARGCGWQKLGAFVNLGSYYLLGVPVAVVLAFVLHMNGEGLFIGIVLALTVQVVMFLLVTVCTDWEKEVSHILIFNSVLLSTWDFNRDFFIVQAKRAAIRVHGGDQIVTL
ncbi:putative multi antimicrobial extrusion protein [Lupinus albus]|uniref:Putative multi antimicrobial extrusion protein n=1 Tax=Lupinus albus TaxID=3870 RepID=A0A6A4PFG4_LUPAL|nr:putative multi antimicrobial extrusion protein [Lupinus albus]